ALTRIDRTRPSSRARRPTRPGIRPMRVTTRAVGKVSVSQSPSGNRSVFHACQAVYGSPSAARTGGLASSHEEAVMWKSRNRLGCEEGDVSERQPRVALTMWFEQGGPAA